MNVSNSHLAALLRQRLGFGYLEHRARLRIERAQLLRRTTTLPVAAVAEMLGYQTPAHFYRRFKQLAGTRPMQFRQQKDCGDARQGGCHTTRQTAAPDHSPGD